MAIYHLRAKMVSRQMRGKGAKSGRLKSALSAAAYRAGEELHDKGQKRWFDFTYRTVEHKEILAPEGAPDWVYDRESLWNQVERAEMKRDGTPREKAQLAREIELTLPRELSHDQQVALVRAYLHEHFVSEGMIADFVIHKPNAADKKPQPHAHVLLTTRRLDPGRPTGFARTKEREWDEFEALKAPWGEARKWHNDVRAAYENGEAFAVRRSREQIPVTAEAVERAREALEAWDREASEQGAPSPAESQARKDRETWHKRVQAALRKGEPFADRVKEEAFPATAEAVAMAAKDLERWEAARRINIWRAGWAEAANQALAAADHAARIDHRTLRAQRDEALAQGDFARAAMLNREPQKPLGFARHIEKAYDHLKQRVTHWVAVKKRSSYYQEVQRHQLHDPVKLAEFALRVADMAGDFARRLRRSWEPVPEVNLER